MVAVERVPGARCVTDVAACAVLGVACAQLVRRMPIRSGTKSHETRA
jgi:hypothetical protein